MIVSPARLVAEASSLVAWVGTAIWERATVDALPLVLFLISTLWLGYMLATWEDGR